MIFLILTIALSAALTLLFKLFDRWGVPLLPVIVVNYWTAVITGCVVAGRVPVSGASLQPWLPWALGLGAGYFLLFNLIGETTRRAGVTAATVASKLSLVIPAALAVALYGDALPTVKIIGILLAFPAVYLATRAPAGAGSKQQNSAAALALPAIVFIGSGGADAAVNHAQRTALGSTAQSTFIVHIFLAAAAIGTAVLIIRRATGRREWHRRMLLAGVLLGVPNYFSIDCFMRMLKDIDFLPSSASIPIANVGIVLAAAVAAMLFFREKPTIARVLGLVLSVGAILLIALSDRARG